MRNDYVLLNGLLRCQIGKDEMRGKKITNIQFQYGESSSGRCSKVFISTSAFRTILHSNANVNKRGFQGEDGSFLVGGFYKVSETSDKVIACIKEAVDGGIQTERSYTSFEFDSEYINHVVKFIRDRHSSAMQLIGMVHFHPDRMNVFSQVDIETNICYSKECSVGWLSGLITIQNGLEMFMYFCENKDNGVLCTAVPVEVSDQAIRKLDKRFQIPRSLKEIYYEEHASLPRIAICMDDEARSVLLGDEHSARLTERKQSTIEIKPRPTSEDANTGVKGIEALEPEMDSVQTR